jgi:hypothetical protein
VNFVNTACATSTAQIYIGIVQVSLDLSLENGLRFDPSIRSIRDENEIFRNPSTDIDCSSEVLTTSLVLE